jgi:hypothetical protein
MHLKLQLRCRCSCSIRDVVATALSVISLAVDKSSAPDGMRTNGLLVITLAPVVVLLSVDSTLFGVINGVPVWTQTWPEHSSFDLQADVITARADSVQFGHD